MDLGDAAVRADVATRLGRVYAGRPVLLAVGALSSATGPVRWLRALGCRVLVVCTTTGLAEIPGPGEAEVVRVPAPEGTSVTERLRSHDRLFRTLPPYALAAIEAFDPESRGVWLATPSLTDDEPVVGRPVTGGRPAAFAALEDKVRADDVFRAAGVPTVPARVVGLDLPALVAATAELGGPLGVVWAGDARDGVNGGGDYVRWVVTESDARAAFAFFAPRCDRVRVAPFLDGVPCSVHGLVLPEGTAAFRPVEIATLRDPAGRTFVHAGLGTYWDPPAADRAEMRAVVRRVGEHLRAACSYRGAFGIDGVLTVDGFRPTELNPRLSAGLTTLADLDPRLLTFLQAALVAGHDAGLGVAEVETLLPRMDARRSGLAVALAPSLSPSLAPGLEVGPTHDLPVTWDGRTLHRSPTASDAVVALAATPRGVLARLVPGTLLRAGDRLADLSVALADLLADLLADRPPDPPADSRADRLDREHGAGAGRLEAAPDVRVRA